MLNVKRHKYLVILIAAFVIAWAVWTFVAVPKSDTPSVPAPVAPANP